MGAEEWIGVNVAIIRPVTMIAGMVKALTVYQVLC